MYILLNFDIYFKFFNQRPIYIYEQTHYHTHKYTQTHPLITSSVPGPIPLYSNLQLLSPRPDLIARKRPMYCL